MAIELCSDDSTPRISFSHDISQTNIIPIPVDQYIRSTNNSSSSSIDFDFCVLHQSFDLDQSSSADELFFNGKILPIEMKKKIIAPTLPLNKGVAKSRKLVIPSNPCFKNEKLIETKSYKLVSPNNICFKNENLIETKSGIVETSSSSSSDDQKQNNNSKSCWNFKRSRSLNCGTSSSTSYARTLCPLPLLIQLQVLSTNSIIVLYIYRSI
ncbi:uncharacterized protein [Nicotiana sylvestris]|uniref:Uncharacterized protein LOC104240923 n=1 Tax=Nicotiana sylvestris TaxID=4096 RepID=A0A1U7Y5R3_NICSY|nr:PREDICTED: uncharacterized protein LOC104240923 [Nicotiana sylvestris]